MPILPTSPLRPTSPYGVHKKMAEDLCRSYAQHFGARIALVRLFSVYGIGIRKQLLWDACSKLCQGIVDFNGTGNETRDWLHVNDAALLITIAEKHAAAACPVVNGGEGRAVSICEVVELLASRINGALSPVFSGLQRPGDPTNYQADISGAIDWGWFPLCNRTAEMNAYVDWYLGEKQCTALGIN